MNQHSPPPRSLPEIPLADFAELTSTFDLMGQVCALFIDAWREQRPDINSFLKLVPEEDRPPLLRNLLEFEIQHRRQRGEAPSAAEYTGLLPAGYENLIGQVFFDLSTWHHGSRTLRSPLVATNPIEGFSIDPSSNESVVATESFTPSVARLGDYRLVRELGRGAMGAVFEAIHIRRGYRVALKTLPTVSGETLHRFKREFRTLAEVSHPNLVGLRTLESDGSQWFITLDLLDGIDFLKYVRPHGQLDLSRVRNSFAQLCAGVLALHAHGVVHRDLKPSNVMVLPDGKVIVLDFGLASEFDRAGLRTASMSVAGTPAYMAPEQASGGVIGPPADWYAVGVMLYESLSGERPFHGGVIKLLQDKCSKDAPPLPNASELPSDLVELCNSMLARTPEARPDPLAIAGVISLAELSLVRGLAKGEALVGRENQSQQLQDLYRTFRSRDQPVFAFIRGRSGEGKSSLAEDFLKRIQKDRDLVVMSGRCYDRESVPFKALDTFVDALTTHLKRIPETDAALLLPDDIGMLCELFPVLRRCEVVHRAPRPRLDALDQTQVRQRAFAALRLLMDRMSARTPIVCFIDDLQWGDSDSAAALFEVLRPPHAPSVLFLGSFRSDEANDSPFLLEWANRQRQSGIDLKDAFVDVGPLSLEQAIQLVTQVLARNDENIRRRAVQFHAQSGGNPFLLTEIASCFDPATDAFHATDMYGVLDRKLEDLPSNAVPLLQTVAVSGQSIPLLDAAEAAGLAETVEDVLTPLRNARLLRVVGDKVDTYHDRIRYAVIDRLPQDRAQTIHLRLAQCIEQRVGALSEAQRQALIQQADWQSLEAIPRVYDISYHYDAAGETEQALAYAMAAAVQARSQYALDVAVQQFAIAQRNAASAPDIVSFRIARGKAEALLQLGRYAESKKELDTALELASSDYDFADVRGLKGELASKQGRIGESIEDYEAGLRRLGIPVPKSIVGLMIGIAWQSLVQTGHTLAPGWIRKRHSEPESSLVTHLLGRIDWSYYCNNATRLVWASLVGMNRAEREPPSRALTINYVVHANDMAVLGWRSRAKKYYLAAQDVSQQLNDHWGMALAANHTSFGCVWDARYRESLKYSEPGIEAFRKLGDVWELHLVYFNLCAALFRLGDFAKAIHYARVMFDDCVRTGDNYLAPAGLFLLSNFALGKIPFEELSGCVQIHPGNHIGQSLVSMAEGYWHWEHGRTGEAVGAFERSWRVATRNFCVMPPNANALNDLIAALRRHSEALERDEPRSAVSVRKRWRRLVPWAIRLAHLFPCERPQAYREASHLALYRGSLRKALRLAEASCTIAIKQEAAYQLVLSQHLKAQIAMRLALPNAEEQVRRADIELGEIDRIVNEAICSPANTTLAH